MTTPENPYITMTAKGIEDMIGKAIAPYVESNRKLLIAFGYATEIASHSLEKTPSQIRTELLGMASRYLQTLPNQTPSELLMTIGSLHWKHQHEVVKLEEKQDGDRDEPVGVDRLNKIIQDAGNEIEEWFESVYGVDWVKSCNGCFDPVKLLPINQNGNHFLHDVWQILTVIKSHEGTIYSGFSMMPLPPEEEE